MTPPRYWHYRHGDNVVVGAIGGGLIFVVGLFIGQMYAVDVSKNQANAKFASAIEAAQLQVSDAFAEANKFRASLYCAAVVPYPPYCEAYRVKP